MDLEGFRSLFTPQGEAALDAAAQLQPREVDFLAHFQSLSKRFTPEIARAALETAILRLEADAKFPQARNMYFTREALEQASSWEVSSYRAGRFKGYAHILDLGCSIGGDTLALAEAAPTTGLDIDPLRLAMGRANANALELPAGFVQADLQHVPLSSAPAAFFDPARRANDRRIRCVESYHPPLSTIRSWLAGIPALGVKLSPGVDLDELAGYDAEVEFISFKGELKEAVLWFGALKGTKRRATLLPGAHTLSAAGPSPALPLSEPSAYLCEPDPAVLRAGLVTDLGAQLDAAQLDREIAYLTADERLETPFARSWQVEDWMPFQLKRLRAYLRERDVGRVTVKKRGSPLVPEELIQSLRLKGEEEKVLFLTQMQGKPIVVIAKAEV